MEKQEHLKKIFNKRANDEQIIRQKIKSGENSEWYVSFLEGANIIYAIYSMYAEKNFVDGKRHFFHAALVAEYMIVNYDTRIIDSGINQVSYALLSDNTELIQRYSTLKNKVNNETGIGFQVVNAIQNILLDNFDMLEQNITNISRLVKVPRFKWWEPFPELFLGFLNRDRDIIENILQTLLQTHKKRNTDPLISRFFSTDTAGLCKLAWLKGMEIDLKNTLVPTELMHIRPLEKYEPYKILLEIK